MVRQSIGQVTMVFRHVDQPPGLAELAQAVCYQRDASIVDRLRRTSAVV